MTLYYVDTCIYLNLWKKEVGRDAEKPLWKYAFDFLEKFMLSDEDLILFSGFILKELQGKLSTEYFKQKKSFLQHEFSFVAATQADYDFARLLESKLEYTLSLYDCMHIALCKRLGLTLVTRDALLLKYAKKHVAAGKPEELLS